LHAEDTLRARGFLRTEALLLESVNYNKQRRDNARLAAKLSAKNAAKNSTQQQKDSVKTTENTTTILPLERR
jgi:hypothetical protein